MSAQLTALQEDALTEFFNIAIGRAAAMLSQMIGEGIALSVPVIQLVGVREAAEVLGGPDRRLCSVMQTLRGDFSAEAMLVFPENQSLEIVRLLLRDSVPLQDITEMEQDALTEVGNIILNACIGTLTNLLSGDFAIGLPQFRLGACSEILAAGRRADEDCMLMLHIDFRVERHSITGYVIFMQDLPSLQALVQSVDRYIARHVSDAARP
ncbi:chemotaxis protein CheC [Niveibacterium sp. SC-1]|uniref:chemotaxis protein CheC n=1 Tax=Niveibacterium sp. SC-1 TaxID=3135646 RepID=UPI00311F870E